MPVTRSAKVLQQVLRTLSRPLKRGAKQEPLVAEKLAESSPLTNLPSGPLLPSPPLPVEPQVTQPGSVELPIHIPDMEYDSGEDRAPGRSSELSQVYETYPT